MVFLFCFFLKLICFSFFRVSTVSGTMFQISELVSVRPSPPFSFHLPNTTNLIGTLIKLAPFTPTQSAFP